MNNLKQHLTLFQTIILSILQNFYLIQFSLQLSIKRIGQSIAQLFAKSNSNAVGYTLQIFELRLRSEADRCK